MIDNQQKQIDKLLASVTALQKVVTKLAIQVQMDREQIRHLKAKNEHLQYEVARLSSRIGK